MDFKIVPTQESMKVLEGSRLLFKETADGFCLLLSKDFKTKNILFKEPIQLFFYLRCLNDYFINFTQLSYTSSTCFDFKQKELSTLLHQGETVGTLDILAMDNDGVKGGIALTVNQDGELYNGEEDREATDYRIQFAARLVYVQYWFYGKEELLKQAKYMLRITGVDLAGEGLSFDMSKVQDQNKKLYVVAGALTPIPLQQRFKGHLVLEANSQDSKWSSYKKILPWPTAKNIIKSESSSDCYAQIFVKL